MMHPAPAIQLGQHAQDVHKTAQQARADAAAIAAAAALPQPPSPPGDHGA